MGRTSITGSSPGFIADYQSIRRNTGRQIDFTKLGDGFRSGEKTIQVNGAVAAGATSITVDALPVDIPIGTFLNFGTYAPVTVTINDASITAGDTSITVLALPGPIPGGTRLNFGGGTNAQVVELNGDHAAAATTLTVLPVDGTIANSQTALFPGGTIQARLTAPAAAAATSLAVDELQFAIPDDAQAVFGGTGSKLVKSGTIMAELSGGKIIPRSAVTGAETATCILLEDAEDAAPQNSLSGYGCLIGGVVFSELLADRASASFATWKGELATNGCTFQYETYSDDRAS